MDFISVETNISASSYNSPPGPLQEVGRTFGPQRSITESFNPARTDIISLYHTFGPVVPEHPTTIDLTYACLNTSGILLSQRVKRLSGGMLSPFQGNPTLAPLR